MVKRLTLDTVRKPFHHQRSIFDDRQQQRRNAGVVAQQVALGVWPGRPEDFLQIRNVERVAIGQFQLAVSFARLKVVQLRR